MDGRTRTGSDLRPIRQRGRARQPGRARAAGPAGGATGPAPVLAFMVAMALALSLAAVTAGCSGGAKGTGATGGGAQAGGAGRATGGHKGATGTTSGAGDVPSAAELKSALLSEHDVGLGSPVDPKSIGGASISGCEPLAGTLNATMAASSRPGEHTASSGFAGGGTGPFLAEGLSSKAANLLAADYSRTTAALKSCRSLTLASGGTHLKFTLTPVAFGGSGTSAVRLKAHLQGFGVNGYLAMRRFGPVVLSYYFFQLGGSSPEPAATYYKQAVAKADRVLALS